MQSRGPLSPYDASTIALESSDSTIGVVYKTRGEWTESKWYHPRGGLRNNGSTFNGFHQLFNVALEGIKRIRPTAR